MEIIMPPESSSTLAQSRKTRGISVIGRGLDWLFSQEHFQIKLLSGTAVGVIVIVLLAGNRANF